MVLVVFGHVPIPFTRLAEGIARILQCSSERWVIQKGHTSFEFPGAEARDFFPAGEMARLMNEAELVVCHGGYGTISEALALENKVIAVPRQEGEHNHSQRELVEALEEMGCILAAYDIADLEKKISEAKAFFPKPLPQGKAAMMINEFIQSAFPIS